MEQGLDELIESLLTKIAFSGLEGLSAPAFVKAVASFYGHGEATNGGHEASDNKQITAEEVAHASIVWKWVTKRKDVIVTPKSAAKRPLADLIPQFKSSDPATESAAEQNINDEDSSGDTAQDQVRLLLSEERQWRAIAGHGPDYKRIPVFEWKALVAIASVGTAGILQGDLTRLTGQDKRSLPTRTDALARKGYIIKKQTMLRGCKTSKLWLAQFSDSVQDEDDSPRGLPEDVLNTPASDITDNWDPVPFSHLYTQEPLNYLSISQAFLMILKAFSAMRYCDLRSKMQVERHVTIMRGLAKSSRWWARVGVVRFEPMHSKQKNKLFKDCLKYVRDPTPKEWADYMSTPKANLRIPSTRRKNKKSAASKMDTAIEASPQKQKNGKGSAAKKSPKIPPSSALIKLSAWDPYKPLPSTFFEIIKRGGEKGSSNTELGMFNLGWPYRKFISTLTTLISLPRSLPPHLQPFAVRSDFTRVGRTMTYKFYAHQTPPKTLDGLPEQVETQGGDNPTNVHEPVLDDNPFPAPLSGQFLKSGGRAKGFRPVLGARVVQRAGLKRDDEDEDDIVPAARKRARRSSPVRIESSPREQTPRPALPPGVYYGKKNSLDPFKSKGRPRNSIVMKFVSPILRDPEFFNRPRSSAGTRTTKTPVPEGAGQIEPDETANIVETPNDDVTAIGLETPVQRRQKVARGRGSSNKRFQCDKCGVGYKNINGLEYHQQKSQTACNPDWQPAPQAAATKEPPSRTEQHDSNDSQDEANDSTQKSAATPKRPLPSRRPKLAVSAPPVPAQTTRAATRRVTVQPVAVHGVIDVLVTGKTRDSETPLRTEARRASMEPHTLPATASPARTAAMGISSRIQETRTPSSTGGGQKLYGKVKMEQDRKKSTIELIQQLLERNDQVLPGDVSLYCLVAGTWSREVKDASLPVYEWKQFQRLIKSMEREHKITSHHYGKIFHGSFQPISVICRGHYSSGSNPLPESLSRKITEIKSKCEEIYPNPYIPSRLSLSEQELEMCTELAKKLRGFPTQGGNVGTPSDTPPKIPRLDYEKPSARPGATGLSSYKKTGDDSDDSVQPRRRKRRRTVVVDNATDDEDDPQVTRRGRLSRYRTSERAGVRPYSRWALEVAPPGLAQALEASSSIHFFTPITPETFERTVTSSNDLSEGDEEDGETDDDLVNVEPAADLDTANKQNGKTTFVPIRVIKQLQDGAWPDNLSLAYFMDKPGGSFTAVGTFPDTRWFQRQNLPQNKREMVDRAELRRDAAQRELSRYGSFGPDVAAIEAWERTPEGAYLQNLGNIAPKHIYINLTVEPGLVSSGSIVAEWQPEFQLSAKNMPDEILGAVSEDDDPSPPERTYVVEAPRRRGKRTKDDNGGRPRRFIKRSQGNWKHRVLFPITKRETGRWNKERAVGATIGREKETELVVAIVMIRKLLGGVDRITDWGLFLKLYPEWSVAGIRKFWIRVTKERASYIEALSRKFEAAFLEAYEKGEIAPIDYEDLANYDWRALIRWGMKLKTHTGVELPTTRAQFDNEYATTDPKKDEEDWRELWFHFQTSTWDRLDAAASLPLTLPATKPPSVPSGITEADLQLARSWVRALCNNKEQSTVGMEIREELLRLGNRDKESLDELLERAVSQLLETKVISKLFGKGLGQVFKVNNHLELRLKKHAHAEKYSQAIAFKAQLDEAFRNGRDVHISINSDDGTIMAMINLQAYGRIRLEDVNFPHVPFGFQPGNYEGRKYPKRYYIFEVKVVPTEKYISNEDLPLLTEAMKVPIPTKGPLGEIPIWCDFFGNIDRVRWAQYLAVVAFAISVKGPLAGDGSVDLLHPVVEVFETQLIMDWLEGMGLIDRVSAGNGATVGEWWWLVVGDQAVTRERVSK
ncbi:hypothetical protein G7054_g11532 [Neopestalotiopsis clavispora]|nr:hypothetical protein G7054_g11532 [Neopestalotiopsis clavispora]